MSKDNKTNDKLPFYARLDWICMVALALLALHLGGVIPSAKENPIDRLPGTSNAAAATGEAAP